MSEKRYCQAKTAKGVACQIWPRRDQISVGFMLKGRRSENQHQLLKFPKGDKRSRNYNQPKRPSSNLNCLSSAKETLKNNANRLVVFVLRPLSCDSHYLVLDDLKEKVSLGEAILRIEKMLSEPMDDHDFESYPLTPTDPKTLLEFNKQNMKILGRPLIKGDIYRKCMLNAIGFNVDKPNDFIGIVHLYMSPHGLTNL